jgi:hypothetical protein
MPPLTSFGPPSHRVTINWAATPPGDETLQVLLHPRRLCDVPILMGFEKSERSDRRKGVSERSFIINFVFLDGEFHLTVTKSRMYCECSHDGRTFACAVNKC